MQDLHTAFVSTAFLRSHWHLDYLAFKGSHDEDVLVKRVQRWSQRKDLKETSAEAALIAEFFQETWGYRQAGQVSGDKFTLYPKFAISGAGPRGGSGEADAALGVFGRGEQLDVPQVVCEFKDIRSALDAPQRRKGSARSPVKQCLDYLSHSRRGMFGNEAILPTWAIVTDMNEFRLYWHDRAPQQYIRFTIRPKELFQGPGLLGDSEEARFGRFLFRRLFHCDTLVSESGRSLLLSLVEQQRFREHEIENEFYDEYKQFRAHLYLALLKANPQGTRRFPGTKGRLVRLAQKILDRCIFIFFCEDMGQALGFPPQLLQDFLIHESRDQYFDPDGDTIWQRLLRLFHAMNEGSAFSQHTLNKFNGGLFAKDEQLERLKVPNSVFCQPGQGQNEASLATYKRTLLYLSANYNYAAGWHKDLGRQAGTSVSNGEPTHGISLYMLGRIFEQSITELEILQADADGVPSINKLSKRKTDGVYYTPEWVVEHIVAETIGPSLSRIKMECGWPSENDNRLPSTAAIDSYAIRLKAFRVLDPACGSGAFLIASLRYLIDEWRELRELRKQISREATFVDDDDVLIRDVLRSNIYGVDVNPASVEISRLALWLHTARHDKPLSALENTIRDGNSLIDSEFYKGQVNLALYDATQKERINAFDWKEAFPEIFRQGGFDAIVGNPPYVKLQTLMSVNQDQAEYLRTNRFGGATFKSTQSGNFDLYVPFIERAIELLNEDGRLGFIAPSLWTINDYGQALRDLVERNRYLDRWVDFVGYQVFREVITYTALQFFTRKPNAIVRICRAPLGAIPDEPWRPGSPSLTYDDLKYGDRWLLLSGPERALIDRLGKRCARLDDASITTHIYQGLITSADSIYHLTRLGPGRYLCKSDEGNEYEVELEEALMKPLISGPEAKRYVEPATDTYILFPYQLQNVSMKLIDPRTMARTYPKAWKYLNSYKKALAMREAKYDKKGNVKSAPFDDNEWYRFGRNQGLDKQSIPKLVVAQTVPQLRVSFDSAGLAHLNNVRVNGIIPSQGVDPWFLLGMLNSPVADFVFRRTAKVKQGGYFEANKQFIAPLPIPRVGPADGRLVAGQAKRLQDLHTTRRQVLEKIDKRMRTVRKKTRPESWLFPQMPQKRDLLADAPRQLDLDARRAWAQQKYGDALLSSYDSITVRLSPTAELQPRFDAGELSLVIDGVPVLDRIFVEQDEGELILAQWKLLASTFSITEKTDGEKLGNALRKLAVPDNPSLARQLIELVRHLISLEKEIEVEEAAMDAIVYRCYALSQSEIEIVRRSTRR